MGKNNFIEADFYCINCGNKTLPLQRHRGHLHGKFHRKKLYCIYCKEEINCVECKTEKEVETFKICFNNGDFINEAKESLICIRGK